MCAETVITFFHVFFDLIFIPCWQKYVEIFANCKNYFDFKSVCKIFQSIFSTTYYLLYFFLSLKKILDGKKCLNFQTQDNNQDISKLRAVELLNSVNLIISPWSAKLVVYQLRVVALVAR